MEHTATLKMAIDLLHVPSRIRLVRSAPLPDGVLTLLRVAAGDEETTSQAIVAMGRSRETVREAAAFFIEQILLYPDADSYRVLGLGPEATNAELRRNMAILLRWLHPDHKRQSARSVFAGRVTGAWNDLKTQERRAAYDRLRHRTLADKSLLRKKGGERPQFKKQAANQRTHNGPYHRRPYGRSFDISPQRTGLVRRVLLLLFGRTVH